MGTWEEESSALFESHNAINKDNLCVNVDVNGDVDGNECGDHEKDVVVINEGGDVVEQLEKLELQNNGSDDSKIDENEAKNRVYPLRPYAVDCSFYSKTGTCKFGQNCRYNHPLRRVFKPVGDKERRFEESIESTDDARKIECKYFQTPGGCKYRDTCRYNHSGRKIEKENLELNFLGLPIRLCSFQLNLSPNKFSSALISSAQLL
ncbi:hypothetical protein RND81_04G024700 [Saponaria officinalis]|uniref:C3H1-type domain-containing protein n=1 Tax=Saponaria officinalis TaxID=3572 RepID=A0AAW1LHY4_SAPOF